MPSLMQFFFPNLIGAEDWRLAIEIKQPSLRKQRNSFIKYVMIAKTKQPISTFNSPEIVVLGPRSWISSISNSFCPVKCLVKGSRDFWRCMKMTAYPCSRKYSAEEAPRVPALKLSTKRTVLCSSGTVVPPDWKRRGGFVVEIVFF